jgi:hypothetical protein
VFRFQFRADTVPLSAHTRKLKLDSLQLPLILQQGSCFGLE